MQEGSVSAEVSMRPTPKMVLLIGQVQIVVRRIYELTGKSPQRAVINFDEALDAGFSGVGFDFQGIAVIASAFCPRGSVMVDVEP